MSLQTSKRPNPLQTGKKSHSGIVHNSSLMHNSNSLPANIPSILKSKPQNLLTRLFRNQLDTLHDPRNNNMLDPRVLALGILSDKDGVDV